MRSMNRLGCSRRTCGSLLLVLAAMGVLYASAAQAASIVQWRSVRTHTGSGDLSIVLDASAGPGGQATTETRNRGIQRIEVDFNAAIAGFDSAGVQILGVGHDAAGHALPPVLYSANGGTSIINGGMTLVLLFGVDTLPDETCYLIDLSGAVPGLTGDTDCKLRALIGDVDGNGSVTQTDMNQITALNRTPLTPARAKYDLNLDGGLNLIDVALCKSRLGRSVTCALDMRCYYVLTCLKGDPGDLAATGLFIGEIRWRSTCAAGNCGDVIETSLAAAHGSICMEWAPLGCHLFGGELEVPGVLGVCGCTPSGACCDAAGNCTLQTQATCAAQNGFYHGDGTTCGDFNNMCLRHDTGACCNGLGFCFVTTQEDCAASGYTYQGDGTTCEDHPCTGACCTAGSGCLIEQADACRESGGTYQGDGTTCDANPCATPIGACCTGDACALSTADHCASMGGQYKGDNTLCEANICVPTGACCTGDACAVSNAPDCAALDGVYKGDGTTCEGNPCSGACCLPDGTCQEMSGDDCTAASGTYRGDGTKCADTVCPPPTGACCLNSGCQVMAQTACNDANGSYKGNGTTCDNPAICPPPVIIGACCMGTTCSIQLQDACYAQGGDFKGPNTTCDPNPCIPVIPRGACCYPDGHCNFQTELGCQVSGGKYQGDGILCEPNPCPQPTGACCDGMGGCSIKTEADCSAAQGHYRGPDTTCDPNPCCPVDLDVNSDNSNNKPDFGPSRSDFEEQIEDDPQLTGRFVGVNNDDDDNDGVVDFYDGYNRDGIAGNADDVNEKEDDFVQMVFELGEDLRVPQIKIRVSYGDMRIWTKGPTEKRDITPVAAGGNLLMPGVYSADQLGLTDDVHTTFLWIEGFKASTLGAGTDRILFEIDPDGDGPKGFECSDAVRTTVLEIDADIDSDNNNGIDPPDRTTDEDEMEDRADQANIPGKIVEVNGDDDDDDGIPDMNDGYNRDGINGNKDDLNDKENDFVPLILELRKPIDLGIARVKITYSAEPPGGAGANHLRLWRKKGDEARNKAKLIDNPAGDYVAPGIYDASRLGFAGETRVITLYVEAINPSAKVAEDRILFELDPDAPGPVGRADFIYTDAVRVTSFALRYILDNNNGNVNDDPALPVLNISNLVTNVNLGNANGQLDPDNFKIEVQSSAIAAANIPQAQVTLEAFDRDGLAFNPRRTLQVPLARVGATNRFRSQYLRLVTDAVDRAAMPAQTLLTSTELPDVPATEILGQIARCTYQPTANDTFEQHATVGDEHKVTAAATDDHRAFNVTAHRLTDIAAGANVTDAAIRTRFNSYTRERYAQCNVRIRERTSAGIRPLQNYVSISHDHGRNATGGMAVRITISYSTLRNPGAVVRNYQVSFNPPAGSTSLATANALQALIAAQNPNGHAAGAPNDFLAAQTFQNPQIFAVARQSADILITDPMGGVVTVTAVASNDANQTIQAPPANNALIVWSNNNWLVGSIQQRALIRSYDAGPGTVDIYVAQTLTQQGGGALRGAAMIFGGAQPAAKQGAAAIINNAFVDATCADTTANNPFVIAHEIGHCLLDAVHVANTTQIMDNGGTAVNPAVNGEKRFQDTNIGFDSVGAGAAGNLNQVTTIRGSGMLTND